jgi:hypothetical protein
MKPSWSEHAKTAVSFLPMTWITGALLYATRASAPSVIQLRCEDVCPATMQASVLSALDTLEADLINGALVTIDPGKRRVRTLPFRSQ